MDTDNAMTTVDYTKMFTAIVETFTTRNDEEFDLGENNHRKGYGTSRNEWRTWGLVFSTYAPNVPEDHEYTVEEALALADDEKLLAEFPPPFFITSVDCGGRAALYAGRHASGFLADCMMQLGTNALEYLVIKAKKGEPAFAVNMEEEVHKCRMPEKHVYGCKACVESIVSFEGACTVKECLCPKYDTIKLAGYGKPEAFLPSRKSVIYEHTFISPTMLHDKDERKFQGIKDISFGDLDFSSYADKYERRLEALVERQKTLNNVKEYCSKCSVADVCLKGKFRWHRRSCQNPRPGIAELSTSVLRYEQKTLSKRNIAEIISLSGKHNIKNPSTGRTSKATLGLANMHSGLGFCVHRVSDYMVMLSGNKDETWEKFKASQEIKLYERRVQTIEGKIEDDIGYALVVACANVKESPTSVGMWRKTNYPAMYFDAGWGGNYAISFYKPSSRDVAPWKCEIGSLIDLYEHYGSIPGSTW
jgi:hypothetical protein